MYEPNFNDPRVRKRCFKALGFAYGILGKSEKECHSRSMDRFFSQGQGNLSRYLKAQLLTPINQHYRFGAQNSQCKTYKINSAGAKRLYNDLYPKHSITKKRKTQLVVSAWEEEYKQELVSGKFEYTEKSNRYWHTLQNINSEHRKQLFSNYGYSHIYDIKACAPTLIAHLADMYAPKQTITVQRMNQTFTNFLNNTHEFRQHIADIADCEYSVAKKIINSLFAGANLGCNRDFDTFKLLGYSYDKMNALKADDQLRELKSAIAKAWKLIREGEQIHLAPGKRMNSSQKWDVYFSYEKVIMNVITDYMDKEYVSYFIEHDGWSCNVQLDLEHLLEVVRTKTGIMNLEIDYDCFSPTNTAC